MGVQVRPGTSEAKVAIMQLTTQAATRRIQRGQQQAATASAGEAEGPEALGVDARLLASTSRATRSSVSTAPAKV